MKFDDEVLEWVRDALHASHADERREQEEATKRLQAEYKRLEDRVKAMYVGKLDGVVDTAFFEKMSNQWREEQSRCLREIDRHQNADKSYIEEGVRLLELARNAQRLFEQQEPRQKRRLLNFVLSNCTWDDGEVVAKFRQPLDLLAETTFIAANREAADAGNSPKSEIWLGDLEGKKFPELHIKSMRCCHVIGRLCITNLDQRQTRYAATMIAEGKVASCATPFLASWPIALGTPPNSAAANVTPRWWPSRAIAADIARATRRTWETWADGPICRAGRSASRMAMKF